jgi:preprotein translocase subunit SecF
MKTIDFMGQAKLAVGISVVLMVISIVSLATRQLNWGLDFTGGTLIEVHYDASADLNAIRSVLEENGYAGAVVTSFGSDQDVLIRLQQEHSEEQGTALLAILQESLASNASDAANGNAATTGNTSASRVDLLRVEFVGPQMGDELREQGGLAMLLSLFLIMIYVAFRFQFKFAVGSVVALVHDVILTLGFFSVTGMEFNLNVLAAVLTVIGYSINDTIVIFDRIRENFRKLRRETPAEVINISLTETLERTFATAGTVLLTVIALALFGGDMLFGFAIALIVGVIAGTYSSVYMAAATTLMMGVSKEDLLIPVKEGAEQDDLTP